MAVSIDEQRIIWTLQDAALVTFPEVHYCDYYISDNNVIRVRGCLFVSDPKVFVVGCLRWDGRSSGLGESTSVSVWVISTFCYVRGDVQAFRAQGSGLRRRLVLGTVGCRLL